MHGVEATCSPKSLTSVIIANPLDIRAVIEFPVRRASYVRLRQLSQEGYVWPLAELEVWSGQ